MESWKEYTYIGLPSWIIDAQIALQSKLYKSDEEKMQLVFHCASLNVKLAKSAPLAACIFSTNGELISIGLDYPGISGHEMSNALIIASNIMGSSNFRRNKNVEMFSLAPPCAICQGNIFSEAPKRFVSSVSHKDLLSELKLPDTPFPRHDWETELQERGIIVKEGFLRNLGLEVLKSSRNSNK